MAHRHKKHHHAHGGAEHGDHGGKGPSQKEHEKPHVSYGDPEVLKEAENKHDHFKKGGHIHGKKAKHHHGKHHKKYARGGRHHGKSPFSSAHVKTSGDA